MKRLISDLIDIPERVQKGDFVLGLTQGVKDPAATLKDYVVTEQLVGCFDDALSFIRSAIETGSSKAAFLHGSFGSGKSHFMAVLHLLLQHNPDVRGVARLAPVVGKHGRWLDGRKLLLVPTHMIGQRTSSRACWMPMCRRCGRFIPMRRCLASIWRTRSFRTRARCASTTAMSRFSAC